MWIPPRKIQRLFSQKYFPFNQGFHSLNAVVRNVRNYFDVFLKNLRTTKFRVWKPWLISTDPKYIFFNFLYYILNRKYQFCHSVRHMSTSSSFYRKCGNCNPCVALSFYDSWKRTVRSSFCKNSFLTKMLANICPP